jgi:glycosyltransferase involved in cell wall biosynthesis
MAGGRQGGAEAFFTRLAAAFDRCGEIEQCVLVRRGGAWVAPLRAAGVTTVELPFGGWFDFKSRNLFQTEIAAFKPAVVLTWMNRASKFCPKSTPAAPFVHVARLGGYYDLKNYRHCDHLIGNTRDIVDYVTDAGWPSGRAQYLPNFVSRQTAPAASRQAHDTPDDAPLVLALGRLHANKAFDVLLQAFVAVPGAYLWIAGDGPERRELAARSARLGLDDRVRFLGWRDDAEALFAAADVFVCPSRHEPLGNVVIEAWAQQKPVVATRSQGPGALISDGETGLLATVDDADHLAAALNRVIAEPDLRSRLARAGLAAYEAEFTEQAVVAQYLKFFHALAAAQ